MLDRDNLAKNISTNWESLPKNLDIYVPWISYMVYHNLYTYQRGKEDVVDEIVHNIIIKVLMGLESNHFKKGGPRFRSILYNSAIFSTKDFMRKIKQDNRVVIAADMKSDENDEMNYLESIADTKTEEEAEEVSYEMCIETLVPVLLVNEKILSSIKNKKQDKERLKEAEKLISFAILGTIIYLDFNRTQTATGLESLVAHPPKAIHNLIGFWR